MNWILLVESIYVILLIIVCTRIIYDTSSGPKTLAYLLFAIFVPLIGILFYFFFGINYRKRLIYTKKLIKDIDLQLQIEEKVVILSKRNIKANLDEIENVKGLVKLLVNDSLSPLTIGNKVKILLNGENKFPEVIEALQAAKHHIHIEYYIYENDGIGNLIKDVLIQKAKEGVEVRLIYDDFGSRSIRKKLVKELRENGVEAYPFNKVRLLYLANRLNYRNHRKIIIVDGSCAFIGGINVSDKYINKGEKEGLFWRDTHLRIDGTGMYQLQYLFLCDWNFCSGQKIEFDWVYFNAQQYSENIMVQIAASGPDSPTSTIMLSLLKAIALAEEEILITTPYFIPGESILDSLKVAALGGVSVKILAPGISDSRLVNAAAWSNYGDLLDAGVEIYLYQKGFIHAKTIVVDRLVSIIGTANMDFRSFDLNFEVNAIIYDRESGEKMSGVFYEDIQDADQIQGEAWKSRPLYKQLPEKIARLVSPLL